MVIKIGFIMDPLESININKDSTLAVIIAAQQRGWITYYIQPKDLWMEDGQVYTLISQLEINLKQATWFKTAKPQLVSINELNIVLMRQDPPFNLPYLYMTYLLEHAEKQGCLIVNKPQSLRDHNEKIFISTFPQCCAPTLVSNNPSAIKDFVAEQQVVICKPLNAMGGQSIFKTSIKDQNLNVIIETMTKNSLVHIMVQKYITDIQQGDKRILLVDGEAFPYALARIPSAEDFRGNLAAGGKGEVRALTARDQWICEQIKPTLKEKGLIWVGIDVIGDYLTEINVTSPTCIREIEAGCPANFSEPSFTVQLLDCIEKKLLNSFSKLHS